MDSAGLAQAVTNYWCKTYQEPEDALNEQNQLPVISIAGSHRRIKQALSSQSARAWLLKLGWNWNVVKKGVYQDEHEKEDVKAYRQDVFLPRMKSLQPHMME